MSARPSADCRRRRRPYGFAPATAAPGRSACSSPGRRTRPRGHVAERTTTRPHRHARLRRREVTTSGPPKSTSSERSLSCPGVVTYAHSSGAAATASVPAPQNPSRSAGRRAASPPRRRRSASSIGPVGNASKSSTAAPAPAPRAPPAPSPRARAAPPQRRPEHHLQRSILLDLTFRQLAWRAPIPPARTGHAK